MSRQASAVIEEMVERALDAGGRAEGLLGPVRMRAALEAVIPSMLLTEPERRALTNAIVLPPHYGSSSEQETRRLLQSAASKLGLKVRG